MRPYSLLFSCILLLGAASLSAQPLHWPSKIDPALRNRIQSEGSCEFLVILTAQADVSAADKMALKEEKEIGRAHV